MPFAGDAMASSSAAEPQGGEPSKRLALEAEGHALAEELSSFVDEVGVASLRPACFGPPIPTHLPHPCLHDVAGLHAQVRAAEAAMVQVAELSQTFAAHVAAQAAQVEELCV